MSNKQGFSDLAFRVWFTPKGNVYSVSIWKPCTYQRKTALLLYPPLPLVIDKITPKESSASFLSVREC